MKVAYFVGTTFVNKNSNDFSPSRRYDFFSQISAIMTVKYERRYG